MNVAPIRHGLVLSALLLAACTPPSNLASNNETKSGGDAATTRTLSSSATSGTQQVMVRQGAYDPAKDPLLNPKQMFEQQPADAGQWAQDQVLIRHLAGSPNTLNPLFYSTRYDADATAPLYDDIISFDKDFNWMTYPDMVESHEVTPDQKVWTFKLREGLTWHDGHPLTSEDFRFSWLAVKDENVPAFTFKEDAERLEDVKIIDARTFQIIHKDSLPINKWATSQPLVPKHIFDNAAERAKDPTLRNSPYFSKYSRETVIGNGPYKLVEWIPNDRIVYERWNEYKGAKGSWKKIIFKIQPDRNTSLQLFRRGEIDELEVTPQQFVFETDDPAFAQVGHKVLASTWGYSHITWNMDGSNPFFNDKNVRIAMAHACNLPYILENVGYNLFTPCYGIFAPDSWMFNREVKLLGYDLNKASQLLDEAGWLRDQADGWRYKTVNGSRVKFSFEMLIGQGSMTAPPVAAIYGEDLKKIGIELRTREIEFATLHDMLQKHEFQAEIGRWGTGVYPDTNENLWKTEMYNGGRNYGGYSNKRVDELIELATREFDEAKRKAYFQEIQKLIYDDQPSIFIWNDSATYVVNNKLRGLELSPRGIFNFYPSYFKWWIPAGQTLHNIQ